MNVAIIPARGGSKRIPRKNIKLFRFRRISGRNSWVSFEPPLRTCIQIELLDVQLEKLGASQPAK